MFVSLSFCCFYLYFVLDICPNLSRTQSVLYSNLLGSSTVFIQVVKYNHKINKSV